MGESAVKRTKNIIPEPLLLTENLEYGGIDGQIQHINNTQSLVSQFQAASQIQKTRKCQWDWKGTWSQFLKGTLTFFHLTLSGRTALKEYQINLEDPKLWHAIPNLTEATSMITLLLSPTSVAIPCHGKKTNTLSVTASFLLAFGSNYLTKKSSLGIALKEPLSHVTSP